MDHFTAAINAIERFDHPWSHPDQQRIFTEGDLLHHESLLALRERRYEIFSMGSPMDSPVDYLDDLLAEHRDAIARASELSEESYFDEVADLHDAFEGELDRLAAKHKCRVTPEYLKARSVCKRNLAGLLTRACIRRVLRQKDLARATELMHRQFVMHAFTGSSLAWNARLFFNDGMLQGCYAETELEEWRLRKNADHVRGHVYNLRLTWQPARGATLRPVSATLDRVDDGMFAVESVQWEEYSYCTEAYDWAVRNRRSLPSFNFTATIRCRLVGYDLRQEQVVAANVKTAKESYRKSLSLWGRLTYKEGDFEEALEETVERASMASAAATKRWC